MRITDQWGEENVARPAPRCFHCDAPTDASGAYAEPSGRADTLAALMRLALFHKEAPAACAGLLARLADPEASCDALADDLAEKLGVNLTRQGIRYRLATAAKHFPALKNLLLPRAEGSLIESKSGRGGRPTHRTPPAPKPPPQPLPPKPCKFCGQPFVPDEARRKFCGPACVRGAKNADRRRGVYVDGKRVA